MFNDPIENLTVEDVCNILSDTMSNSLVDGARQAGAVGPISCGVILLQGALESVRRRLYYEQAIHELKKMLAIKHFSQKYFLSCYLQDNRNNSTCTVRLFLRM